MWIFPQLVKPYLTHPVLGRGKLSPSICLHGDRTAEEMSVQLFEAFQVFFLNKNYDLKHLLC